MRKITKTALSEFNDDHIFYIGTYIRIYGVKDLAAKKEEEDYYEYMIAEVPGADYNLITNVSRETTTFKAGYSLATIKICEGSTSVTCKDLKRQIGFEKTYIIEY